MLDCEGMPSAEEQASRNAAIVADYAAGMGYPELARKYGLSESRVKAIIADWKKSRTDHVPTTATMRAAEGRRAEYAEATAELRRLALSLPDEQPSAKVGALRTWLDSLDRLTALDQALGHLPRDLNQVGDDRDFLQTAVDVFREHEVPATALHALADRLGGDRCAA